VFYPGKYSKFRKNNFKPVFICDISGFVTNLGDQREQLQFAGRALVKTGFLVNERFMDKPNAQLLTPFIKADPKPVLTSRENFLPEYVYQPFEYTSNR
jgi:hypothetical protein